MYSPKKKFVLEEIDLIKRLTKIVKFKIYRFHCNLHEHRMHQKNMTKMQNILCHVKNLVISF